ncbi:hypothetical protein KR074_000204, partial [Drosophila pseudoananassae]
LAQTMDDMVFQCNNQNSIYVLNASYSAYGDFSTYAATTREINGSRSRVANPIEATCSSGVVQHKFKTFGNSKATAVAAASASASAATTTTSTTGTGAGAGAAGTGTAAESASNYVNPVATSMSTAMCSPATAALQKLFNCSVGGACQNVTHTQALGSHNNNHSSISNSNNNGSHNNSCLSAAGIGGGGGQNSRNQHQSRSRCGESLEGTASGPSSGSAGAGAGAGGGAGATTAGGLPPLLAKKKCTNVKSALIAKKTKFLKYLEEEKWRSNAAAAPEDAGTVSNWAEPPPSRNNNGGNLKNQSISREQAGGAGTANGNGWASGSGRGMGSASGSGSEQRQLNKLNNWSMHNEDNNALTTTQQQQLYQEAADILGLSCSLCDNCRCLDCQSGYFDCDDDDESYSEQSLMDDEFEYDEYEYDCSVEELQAMLTAGGGGSSGSVVGQNWNWNSPTNNPCCQLDTHLQLPSDKGESHAVNTQQHTEQEPEPEPEPGTELGHVGHRVAIDFDLINATCSQVLENCETFNDLSLLDAATAAGVERPFT